jgi:hypothetical protein
MAVSLPVLDPCGNPLPLPPGANFPAVPALPSLATLLAILGVPTLPPQELSPPCPILLDAASSAATGVVTS